MENKKTRKKSRFPNNPIASNIKKYRLEQGLTQTDLGKKAQVSLYTIAGIEIKRNDNPKINTMKKIADALGKSVDELIKAEETIVNS